ncbi:MULTISPECIES: DUF6233 domain-containing protein [Streptomyces albidoflavus group]|uniref:DUF6233 domain-containing protein n=1 Tax=Streptomyces albidoflavus group TaxID=1477431 RepID=UPI0008F5170F|nr:DUF6233 domain-containing protein [Streptomyces sampsonii]
MNEKGGGVDRLELLRFAERVAERHLAEVRGWREAEERRRAEARVGEARRPPPPDWVLQLGIGHGAPPVCVHDGGCYATGPRIRPLTRDQLLEALDAGVEACTHCRPDAAVGYLG